MDHAGNKTPDSGSDRSSGRWAFRLRTSDDRHPKASAIFSTRFLLCVSAVIACAFAGIGAISGSWTTQQLFVCVATILGWCLLAGLAVFLLLNWRRNLQGRLGKLLYRSHADLFHGTHPIVFASPKGAMVYVAGKAPTWMAIAIFLTWCVCAVVFVQFFDWNTNDWSFVLKKTGYWGWSGFLLGLQVFTLYIAIARPVAIEIFTKGIRASELGAITWDSVTSTHWAVDGPSCLVCKFAIQGGGGMIQRLSVPVEDRLMIDDLLAGCLGDKHTRRNEHDGAEALALNPE